MSPETGIDDAVAAVADDVLEMLNDEFAEASLLVARVLGDRPDATVAEVLGVDRAGITARVTDLDGEHVVRVAFAEPVDDVDQLTERLFALVEVAREQSGEEGDTDAERAAAEMASIRTLLTEVHAVEQIHPHLRRITFKGGDLGRFTWPAADTFVYVLLPPPGRDELTVDRGFSWETVGDMAPEDQPVGAYYTVRDWRPEVEELDALFVLHGDEGPASAWAGRVAPGDPVALWGPRTAYHPPEGTGSLLLVADETGLPAVAVILEQAPPEWPVTVIAESRDEAHRQPLPERAGATVTWLDRGDRPPGTTTLLVDAVAALDDLGPTPYCWGGGESRTITAVRRHLRTERGLGREAVSMTGYWRREPLPGS